VSNLSNTEKKLASIWKLVFCLSEREWQSLDRQSDFKALTRNFCEKIGSSTSSNIQGLEEENNFVKGCVYATLVGHVDSDFGIWSEGLTDHRTLGEQAVFIDCCLAIVSLSNRPQKMIGIGDITKELLKMPLSDFSFFSSDFNSES
jgi:hypothetical protein